VFKGKGTKADGGVRSVCTYCGVGCNLEVKVKDNKVVAITAPYDAESNQGHTCLKGRYAFHFYDHPERLRTPLIRKNGELVPASWDEAYDFIVHKFADIVEKHGGDAIAGVSSARCPNEENYLMQKFIRVQVGTNNIDNAARVCHAPSTTVTAVTGTRTTVSPRWSSIACSAIRLASAKSRSRAGPATVLAMRASTSNRAPCRT